MDFFVLAHTFGWFLKSLVIRDRWLLWITSVMFEVMEYSLEHQLPNFAECWWDHWIMDVLTCNWFGIWAGMKVCDLLHLKTYSWQNIPSDKGIKQKLLSTLRPRSWTKFDWAASKSFKGYCVVLLLIALILIDELTLFYMKALLWIPHNHSFVILRSLFHLLMSAVGMRETYQFFTDK